ncbi:hypothetical protein SCARR_05359 [Pontiella sulfatireligans]|uniref:Uncharacterized protein n=2 Tax=Pontiella sulfatireligans TaxID=2750658 RepID=A0A6C2USE4_9BACT|nr:hypothetical protein SCARR_05359 [Pontiella sulfatireligans]
MNPVFEYKGEYYSVSKRGVLCKAEDPDDPWKPTNADDVLTDIYEPAYYLSWLVEDTESSLYLNDAIYNYLAYDWFTYNEPPYLSPACTFLASSEFQRHPNNLNPGVPILSIGTTDSAGILEATGIYIPPERMNHTSVNLLADEELLEIYFYVSHDPSYRFADIYRIVLDLSEDDFQDWTVAIDEGSGEYMFDIVVTVDQINAAVAAAHPEGVDPVLYADPNSLGQPSYFADNDGSESLFYTYYSTDLGGIPDRSEGQISAIRIFPKIANAMITSVNVQGSAFIITGTGTVGAAYTVVGSTNLNQSVDLWTIIESDSINEAGSFSNSIPLDPAFSHGYYQLTLP